jgi:hypothetical protein
MRKEVLDKFEGKKVSVEYHGRENEYDDIEGIMLLAQQGVDCVIIDYEYGMVTIPCSDIIRVELVK